MIMLYTFGPAWGLPDPSPFVTKAMVLLKMSGLPFETDSGGFRKAPRGKLPYIRDGEEVVADSTLIRLYLERRHNIDFDQGLTAEQRGIAWAAEKMCEDHLYWLIVQARWVDGDSFERGPASFFNAVPAPLRPFIKSMVRRQVRRNLHGQGVGRYSAAERTILADRALASLSAILGGKPYLMGDKPLRRRCHRVRLRWRHAMPGLRHAAAHQGGSLSQPAGLLHEAHTAIFSNPNRIDRTSGRQALPCRRNQRQPLAQAPALSSWRPPWPLAAPA